MSTLVCEPVHSFSKFLWARENLNTERKESVDWIMESLEPQVPRDPGGTQTPPPGGPRGETGKQAMCLFQSLPFHQAPLEPSHSSYITTAPLCVAMALKGHHSVSASSGHICASLWVISRHRSSQLCQLQHGNSEQEATAYRTSENLRERHGLAFQGRHTAFGIEVWATAQAKMKRSIKAAEIGLKQGPAGRKRQRSLSSVRSMTIRAQSLALLTLVRPRHFHFVGPFLI